MNFLNFRIASVYRLNSWSCNTSSEEILVFFCNAEYCKSQQHEPSNSSTLTDWSESQYVLHLNNMKWIISYHFMLFRPIEALLVLQHCWNNKILMLQSNKDRIIKSIDIEQFEQRNIYTPNKITKNGSCWIYSRFMTFQYEILTLNVSKFQPVRLCQSWKETS